MAEFSKTELLHIANLSALKLEDGEIDLFAQQIRAILTYVDQLQHISITAQAEDVGNINVFREDVAVRKDCTDIVAQAPETDEGYFTVPQILDAA